MIKVLMLSKDNLWCERARDILIQLFGPDNIIHFHTNKKYQKIPHEILTLKGDLLISFLSPWIVPKDLIDNFRIAINFHPGPPEYPGTGCYNFALYEDAKEYGVTCHFMTEHVDSGPIIKVIRFPIFPNETVKSLQQRALDHLLILFYEIIYKVYKGEELKISSEKWLRKPFTRRDLENLRRITTDMPREEVEKRIKATEYPNKAGAFIELHGFRFYFHPKSEEWD